MPIINIKIAEGRTLEQKQKFVEEVTKVAVQLLDVRAEWVTVLFNEYNRDNWATEGIIYSIKYSKGCGKDGTE